MAMDFDEEPFEINCNVGMGCCDELELRQFCMFTSFHLRALDPQPEDDCMICLQPFGSINEVTGREDIAVQITGIHGCSHVFGAACLEQMWYDTTTKIGLPPYNRCPLDQVEWFEEVPENVSGRPRTRQLRQNRVRIGSQLARYYNADRITARYLLWRETELKDHEHPFLNDLYEEVKLDRILYAVFYNHNYSTWFEMLQLYHHDYLSQISSRQDNSKVKQFFDASDTAWSVWRKKMDPFKWKYWAYGAEKGSRKELIWHYLFSWRLVNEALRINKGRRLHSLISHRLSASEPGSPEFDLHSVDIHSREGLLKIVHVGGAIAEEERDLNTMFHTTDPFMFHFVTIVVILVELLQAQIVDLSLVPVGIDYYQVIASWSQTITKEVWPNSIIASL